MSNLLTERFGKGEPSIPGFFLEHVSNGREVHAGARVLYAVSLLEALIYVAPCAASNSSSVHSGNCLKHNFRSVSELLLATDGARGQNGRIDVKGEFNCRVRKK